MTAPLTRRVLADSDAAAYAALSSAIADGGGFHRENEETFRFYLGHPLASPEFEDFQGVFDGEIGRAHV